MKEKVSESVVTKDLMNTASLTWNNTRHRQQNKDRTTVSWTWNNKHYAEIELKTTLQQTTYNEPVHQVQTKQGTVREGRQGRQNKAR